MKREIAGLMLTCPMILGFITEWAKTGASSAVGRREKAYAKERPLQRGGDIGNNTGTCRRPC
jgi:hypothetical protein